jgi:uncharacterized protein YdaU (DUF1376 family)
MPFYMQDFCADTFDLQADEIGCYVILLALSWRRDDAGLPNDMEWLKRSLKAHAAGFHGLTFNRVIPKLLRRYFELGPDNIWRNPRLVKEWEKARERSEKQARTAHKRWVDHRRIKLLANAMAIPSQPHKKERR